VRQNLLDVFLQSKNYDSWPTTGVVGVSTEKGKSQDMPGIHFRSGSSERSYERKEGGHNFLPAKRQHATAPGTSPVTSRGVGGKEGANIGDRWNGHRHSRRSFCDTLLAKRGKSTARCHDAVQRATAIAASGHEGKGRRQEPARTKTSMVSELGARQRLIMEKITVGLRNQRRPRKWSIA